MMRKHDTEEAVLAGIGEPLFRGLLRGGWQPGSKTLMNTDTEILNKISSNKANNIYK